MARRARAGLKPLTFLELLECRVLFTAVHNDSFDVTGLTTLRSSATYSSITGSGVGIAVLDTGVDAANPELSNVKAYYNAVENAVPTSITAASVSAAADNEGHGTHVSGIAASSNASIGVAYGANLVDVKVIADSGEQQLAGDPLLRGLQFVQRFATQFNIKVVNMSLGESTSSGGVNDNSVPSADDISAEIQTLQGMGITVVAAAGNSYANNPAPGESYPAVVSTISVASTWADSGAGYDFNTYSYGTSYDSYAAYEQSAAADRFSATSQRSTLSNQVAAPGVDIYSDWNGSSTDNSGSDLLHNTISGTSMAAPFVSGLVALMQQAAYTYGGRYITSPAQVLSIIKSSSDTITDANVSDNGRIAISNGAEVGSTTYNLPETGDTFSRVNVYKAIEAVQALFTGTVSHTDTDDTTATATSVTALDGTAVLTETGNVGTDGLNSVGANDVDLYKVTLESSGSLTLALSDPSGGTAFTADLRLFNSSGTQINAAVGTTAAGYPSITTASGSPLAAGTYYVGVSSAGNASYTATTGANATGGSTTGDYTLTLTLTNPDPNGVVQGAVAVDLTAPNYEFSNDRTANVFNGDLGSDPAATGGTTRISVPNGDVDMFKVVAPDTGTLTIATNATTYGSTGADTFTEVFTVASNGAATAVASNGVSATGASNSGLTFNVTIGDTYYVAVTTYSNRGFSATNAYSRVAGSTATDTYYDLYLTFDNGNTNGTALLATSASVGTTMTGDIGSTNSLYGANGGSKYVNWYTYTAPAAGLLDLTATATSSGFSPDVQLWTLTTNSDGTTGITAVAGITGSGQSLADTVAAGQTVYVSVTGLGNTSFNYYALGSGSGGQTGTYTLASQTLTTAQGLALSDNAITGATPGTLTTGTPISGNVGMDNGLVVGDTDVDLYKFTPTVTGLYDLRTNTSDEASADTVLRLFDANGNQIAVNDNADDTTTASFIRAALTAGTTYYVGVSGTGNAAYDATTGAGTTASTSTGTYVLSAAVATLPAITISTPAPVSPTTGATSLTFTVSLDIAPTSAVTVDYATVDGTAAAGTDYTATSGTLTFAAGQTSQAITVPILTDAGATGTLTFTMVLSSPSSNALLDGGEATGTISDLTVTQLPIGGKTRAAFTDAGGHHVVISLAGPGTGTVSVIGDNAVGGLYVVTNGTTAASRLTVQNTGTTTVSGVQINGSLAALSAAHTDLAGDLTVTGTIGSLVLAGASGDHTLSINGSGAAGILKLGAVSDLTVTTAEPLAQLVAASWTDNTGGDVITTPSIKLLQTTGDFGASLVAASGLGNVRIGGAIAGGTWTVGGGVNALVAASTAAGWTANVAGAVNSFTVNGQASGSLTAASLRTMRVKTNLSGATINLTAANATDLGTLRVGGTISGSTVRTAGNITSVRTGAITNSDVFAGVAPTVTALPTTAADFVADATIVSFTVTGLPGTTFAVTNADIAAAAIGKVSVARVDTTNGGTPFGFATHSLASFTDAEPGVATFRWTPKEPSSALTFAGDLDVSLL